MHNIRVNVTAENEEIKDYWTLQIARALAEEHGGYTIYDNQRGGWVDRDGQLIEEPVDIIETWADELTWVWLNWFETILKDYLRRAEQEELLLTIDGEPYFVDPNGHWFLAEKHADKHTRPEGEF